MTANAKTKSDAAAESVTQQLVDMQKKLSGLPKEIRELSSAQLLELLKWEFTHLQLNHNGPLVDAAQVNDDTCMKTTLTNGYLQNVAQRYVMGVESRKNLVGESEIMVDYMGYPPFKNSVSPTLREANDRVFYLANNLGKTAAGNFKYGEVTYVINQNYQDKMFVMPWDTGAYSRPYGPSMSTPSGTVQDFLHLIQPHFAVLNSDSSQAYTLGSWFERWYNGAPPFSYLEFPYFEVEMSANCWLPEGLLYIIPLFSKMWGTTYGSWLQSWAIKHQIPLVWADGDDSGMLIDPIVGQLENPEITDDMRSKFKEHWDAGSNSTTFANLYDSSESALRMYLPSWLNRSRCEGAEKDGQMILGVTDSGTCVYWTPTSAQMSYECLNDGTCAQSIGGRYLDQDSCDANCGKSKWQCMINPDNEGCAEQYARVCVPNPLGDCPDLSTCESSCHG